MLRLSQFRTRKTAFFIVIGLLIFVSVLYNDYTKKRPWLRIPR